MPQANQPAFIDKLCERLSVETGGVQIYQAIVDKLKDATLKTRLTGFMRQEAQHRDMLASYLTEQGVDDVRTSSSILAEHEGQAYQKLIAEAESDSQLLHILLTVELMDECGWELLINLGRDAGQEDLVRTFASALREEKEHLRTIRGAVAAIARAEMAAVVENPAQ